MLEREKIENAINEIIKIIKEKRKLSNKELIEICEQKEIGVIGDKNNYHFVHEILEVAINNYLSQKYLQNTFADDVKSLEILAELEELEKQIPVQSWRSEDQQKFQQFSSPPTIAFLMTKILNPMNSDLILEPSAGTGSLAVWLKILGCRIHLNEISARRRSLLELQGYHQSTSLDAEFLDDLMPEEIAPDGILMNPPFSASGGRTKNNDSIFGFRHVRSALSRLKTGGKLVALLGTEGATKTDKSQNFWAEIAEENELKAFIHLPKNAFYKYGTNTATSVVCARKGKPTVGENWRDKRKNFLEADCATLVDCLAYVSIFG